MWSPKSWSQLPFGCGRLSDASKASTKDKAVSLNCLSAVVGFPTKGTEGRRAGGRRYVSIAFRLWSAFRPDNLYQEVTAIVGAGSLNCLSAVVGFPTVQGSVTMALLSALVSIAFRLWSAFRLEDFVPIGWPSRRSQLPFGCGRLSDFGATTTNKRSRKMSQLPFGCGRLSDREMRRGCKCTRHVSIAFRLWSAFRPGSLRLRGVVLSELSQLPFGCGRLSDLTDERNRLTYQCKSQLPFGCGRLSDIAGGAAPVAALVGLNCLSAVVGFPTGGRICGSGIAFGVSIAFRLWSAFRLQLRRLCMFPVLHGVSIAFRLWSAFRPWEKLVALSGNRKPSQLPFGCGRLSDEKTITAIMDFIGTLSQLPFGCGRLSDVYGKERWWVVACGSQLPFGCGRLSDSQTKATMNT